MTEHIDYHYRVDGLDASVRVPPDRLQPYIYTDQVFEQGETEPVALKLQHGTCIVARAEADRGGRAKDHNVTTLTLDTTPTLRVADAQRPGLTASRRGASRLTDLAGRVLERVFTTEYGQPIIESERYFGDYDGDGDLDSTDSAAADTLGACRGSSGINRSI